MAVAFFVSRCRPLAISAAASSALFLFPPFAFLRLLIFSQTAPLPSCVPVRLTLHRRALFICGYFTRS
jgi:hypothetical protein